MGLQVWLPLNGNLNNNGIYAISTSLLSGTSYSSSGKIGSALYNSADGQGVNLSGYMSVCSGYSKYTIAAWIYLDSTSTGHSATILSSGNWNTAAGQCCFGLYNYSSGYRTLLVPNKSGWSNGISLSIPVELSKWYHVCITYDGSTTKGYINGSYVGSYASGGITSSSETTNVYVGCATYYSGFTLKGKINDVRIYDEVISEKEIKEIAKGLVLHYPFNENIQALTNCYSYPTFNTSTTTGGWSHWGATGASGTYGQNTNTSYIYRPSVSSYSHRVTNADSATGSYLLYQSPAFDGGHRSLQCIVKETNSLPITESICFPAWNARSGGATSSKWTSVTSLGNGFYLCKVEDIQQDGSNDLVGIYVKPGYTVYFSECYLENDRTVASDFTLSSTISHDTSGYKYDGTLTGTGLLYNNSARNKYSTVFNGSTRIYNSLAVSNILAVSVWVYTDSIPTDSQIIYHEATSYTGLGFYSGTYFIAGAGDSSTTRPKWKIANYTAGAWNHIVVNFDRDNPSCYVNGVPLVQDGTEHWSSPSGLSIGGRAIGNSFFSGKLSDFRLYSTCLSLDDVKLLYNSPISVTNTGSLMTQGELVEE